MTTDDENVSTDSYSTGSFSADRDNLLPTMIEDLVLPGTIHDGCEIQLQVLTYELKSNAEYESMK